jgi:uncharacterized protein (DUF1330 family)
VVIELDSVEQAKAAYDSPAYQEALRTEMRQNDLRIVPGCVKGLSY